MSGMSTKLPLSKDNIDGFALNKGVGSMAAQNLKMLILTNPGERMMVPDFGVGIKTFLFEMMDRDTYTKIEAKIYEQVEKYLPYILITNISFRDLEKASGSNTLGVRIAYAITTIGASGALNITV
jgi:phage baseplate assembly protein W